ncbi:hypothetical protein [Minwuia thermotolerans]|uniref:Helix-turn-helix domain-containing protein n=1 Tax=Minwuia thermotolerans TaxID=2056226 RepID=A0A2M9G0T3_9PROT|nr:hypothetical protein [Minwuia thermotolerans]PJK29316.1 hypothetical protein CVT23_11980 [Minwuia thermotolerans]PJK30499.1 hypothetical protein CVT23_06015 [Minwuia thermotolerans]PJK30722.1 hypothetical protein CVT23_04965 [Minwuia thermotolerans]
MAEGQLPATLNLVADAAGVEAALELALSRGGTRLRVPQRAEGSDLAAIVGVDAARAIVDALADERLEIPLAKAVIYRWLRAKNWSQERAGAAVKICRRTAQHWDRDPKPAAQIDLFD